MPRAFTLIELLVVVTIIVVLLALLAPALDKAIYQAELVTCAAKIRGVGATANTYAMNFKRFYPPHQGSGVYGIKEGTDFRPMLRSYFTLDKQLNDPFVRPANLDSSIANSIAGSYPLWFGWGYVNDKRMNKVGDGWTFTPVGSNTTERFSVIASDYVSGDGGTTYSDHPNVDGASSLANETYDNDLGGTGAASMPTSLGVPGTYTFSRWKGSTKASLRFDLHYGYEDGSVRRYEQIRIDGRDERMTSVAWWSNKQLYPGTGGWLPNEAD